MQDSEDAMERVEKKRDKVVGVPLNEEELRRFYAQMPVGRPTEAAWGRQLILERLSQLEAAEKAEVA